MSGSDDIQEWGRNAGRFPTTHWSMVIAAGNGASARSQEALITLCQVYWYPLYVYVRRQGYRVHQAEDLTQELFTRLLEKDYLAEVRRERDRFRSFLLVALRHFLANEWDRAQTQKRGGNRRGMSIEFDAADQRYELEPAHEQTAELVFERRWALTLLEQVFAQLRREFCAAGHAVRFDALNVFLSGEKRGSSYRQVAGDGPKAANFACNYAHQIPSLERDQDADYNTASHD